MVRSILAGTRSIDAIWRAAPRRTATPSRSRASAARATSPRWTRTRSSSGFHRSIVLQGPGVADVLAGARGAANGGGAASSVANAAGEAAAAEPTLIGQGIKVSAPKVRGMTTAGAEKLLRIPLEVKDRDKLPKKLKASVRWDPIDVSVVPVDPEAEVQAEEAAEPEASAEPAATPEASP